jgi:hypothetical protein
VHAVCDVALLLHYVIVLWGYVIMLQGYVIAHGGQPGYQQLCAGLVSCSILCWAWLQLLLQL